MNDDDTGYLDDDPLTADVCRFVIVNDHQCGTL